MISFQIILAFLVFTFNLALCEFCPDSHPYPYNNGEKCCDVVYEDNGSGFACDGGFISLNSSCCNGTNVACPTFSTNYEPCLRVKNCFSNNTVAGSTPNVADIVRGMESDLKCQELCQANPDCYFFVFNTVNGNCKQKGYVNPTPVNGQILGPKYCGVEPPVPTVNLEPCYYNATGSGGKPDLEVIHNIISAEICQTISQLYPGSEYFVYEPLWERCKIKGVLDTESLVFSPIDILGPKFCPGEGPNTMTNETCPKDYPYPYLSGMYCCASAKEKTTPGEGTLCDGSKINFVSTCCEDDMYMKCPEGWWCTHIHPSAGQCPPEYPFPYLKGDYCCATPWDCERGDLTLGSTCCESNQFVSCPGGSGSCWVTNTNEELVTMAPGTNNITEPEETTLSPNTTASTTVTAPPPDNGCPEDFPFAYFGGSYCCASDQEKSNPVDGEACDGGDLSLDSKCCKGDDFTPCPDGPEKCGTDLTCPVSHPYPYLGGDYCCKFQWEKISIPDGEFCDGSRISLSSSCCEDDEFIMCPAADKCKDTNPDIGSDTCPLSHPYPYARGKYCCKQAWEKVDTADGEACDGSLLSLASSCCEDDEFVPCPLSECLTVNPGAQGSQPTTMGTTMSTTAPDGCPPTHPFAYLNGNYCCMNKWDCNNNDLTIASTCCEGNQFIKCPMDNGPCRLSDCPNGYPFPYLNGDYCCEFNEEKFSGTPGCKGNTLTFTSTCCKGDQFIECPSGQKQC